MADQPIRVEIDGRAYNLGGGDPERTRKLARQVDEAIKHLRDSMGAGADSYQLAILAALGLADELESFRESGDRDRSDIGEAVQGLLTQLEADVESIDKEVDALRAKGSGS